MDGSIAALDRLARELARSDSSVEEVATGLGTTDGDDGGSLRVRPSDPVFTTARVVRRADGAVNHVEVTLASPVAVDELRETFGPPATPPRLHPGDASRLVFRLDDEALPYRAALIATLANGAVTEVALRRDERLG